MSDYPIDREDFLYRPNTYRGEIDPAAMVFNANLQEFARRVGFICDLETNGKIPSAEAYEQIRLLWEQLRDSRVGLGIGDQPPA